VIIEYVHNEQLSKETLKLTTTPQHTGQPVLAMLHPVKKTGDSVADLLPNSVADSN